ncbi:cohesin domain-containing protein [Edaphobacter albus]|uniref:cohesin domain-containing protein n=1 Tax=Edaphobacter sp. 4G125 TaxID=2763071 RepID=UPI0016478491|nr:cohesin domain-containing protein [Edaphobacter sp. 4G125]QNI38165.1 type II and III secretion system protein [Edaphobacter sp. 4G125]
MLYSPERNSLAGNAPTGSVLPGGDPGAGVYSGRRLTLFGVKDADERRMGRGKNFSHLWIASRAAQALPALFLTVLFSASVAHAQSAKTLDKRGQDAEARHDYDAAYEDYRQAMIKSPKDMRYRAHFELMRFQAAVSHVDRGRVLRQNGDLQGAYNEFTRAIAIDGGNQTAQQELDQVKKEIAVQLSAAPLQNPQASLPETSDLATIAGPITLRPVSNDPITLHMVEDVRNVYQAIGKLAGLNVIFDPDYTSKRIPVDLVNVSLADALRIVGTVSGTFYKPVTSNTIFVAQNNPTKRRDLDDLAVQTFYLTNASQQADANEVLTALRNLLDQSSKVTLVPSQNAIVVRATPDQLLLAQKLMNDLDRARPEVTVDVAILQVNRDKLRKLGITLPQSITITPQASPSTSSSSSSSSSSGSTTPNSFTLNTLGNMNATNFGVTIPAGTLDALLTDSDTRILQNPRIRATDGQKASLKIGQKIPIATGSYNAGVATGVASIGVQTQFTYLDVGVNIDMTPTVHYDRQVTLKMHMEVSSQQGSVTISGVTEPIIGQNVVEQTIQLKEGEPSILAGLVSKEEDRGLSGTPGLSELPLFKYFFASNSRETKQNEIVFVLIPHIVRESVLTRLNRRAIDTGTSNSFELRQDPTLSAQDEFVGPARPQQIGQPTTAANAASAAVQQLMQQAQPPTPPPPGSTTPPASTAPQQTPAAGQPISLSVAPPAGNQAVGSTFQVSVNASGANDLYAVPLQIQFNPAVLQLVNVDAGSLLGRDGQPVSIVHRDEGNGLVTISTSRPPNVQGVSGQGSVATLTFKAVAAGDSNLALVKVGARNSSQANLPAVGSQSVVHVK